MNNLLHKRRVLLGDLGVFRNGVNFSKDQMGSGLKLINVKDIFGDSPLLDFENLDLVNLMDRSKHSAHSVQQNDLFFVRSSVKRDGIGLVRLANNSRADAVHCGFVIRFRLNDTDTNALFLTYLLRTPASRKHIINLSGGSAIINISQSALASLAIDLPPLPTQRKIAAILSAYDDLIENNLRRIKILEEMAQNLYREWFVKFRFPGHEQAKFVDSPLGMIPEGWEIKTLGDVLELNYGKALKQEDRNGGNVPVYGSSGVVGFHDKPLVAGPGIVVGRKGNVGSVFWSDNDFYPIDTAYFVTSKLPLRFLYYELQTKNFINNDAAVPGLNRIQAYSLDIVNPPMGALTDFCNYADNFENQTSALRRKNTNLRRTRDLLLSKLISGEVDVSAVDIAVPLEETSA